MWSGYGGHMAWMGVWWIVGLAFIGLVVWAVARAAGSTSARGEDSPETVLKRRYARGELDHDQYERRLADLRK